MSYGHLGYEDGVQWLHAIEAGLLSLARRKDISQDARNVLLDASCLVAWDDAIHIAAPWNEHVSLCGNHHRNLVGLNEKPPDGWSGCWTCLGTAEWLAEKGIGRKVAA